MASFSLLSALGNGSGRISAHHRFPQAVYQSGSVLVLWEYVKATGGTQKFVPLQPNQRCTALFFTRDAQCIVGFWLSQQCHVMFTVWRVVDGAKVAEHGLTDKVGGTAIHVDYQPDLSQFAILHAGPAATVTVIHWASPADRPQYVAHGHVGAQNNVLDIRLLDAQHFMICSPAEVSFWSFLEQMPRLVLQVMLEKPVRSFSVRERLLYLVPEHGPIQIMNYSGALKEYSLPSASGSSSPSQFTVVIARGNYLCFGDEDGGLHLYDATRMQPLRYLLPPDDLLAAGSSVVSMRAVSNIAFGMNDDYLCVCFADGTYGIVHLDVGQYISVRIGHRSPVHVVVPAPELQLPAGLASRLLDPERAITSKALAFISLAEESNWITWPRRGAPTRCSTFAFAKPPPVKETMGLEVEVYIPQPIDLPTSDTDKLRGPPLVLSAVAFHPVACLSPTGDMGGAYRMVVGATDGCLQAVESMEESGGPSQRLRWRTMKVRDRSRYGPDIDANRTLPPAWLQGAPDSQDSPPQPVACRHLAFSRCGRFVAASFSGGCAEMLHFPSLESAVLLSTASGDSSSSGYDPLRRHLTLGERPQQLPHAKAFFVRHPLDHQSYDRNIYVVCHTLESRVLILYEVYPFGGDWSGSRYAKNSRVEYRLPDDAAQPGFALSQQGRISDFAAHPSDLYLVVAATWPSLQRRPVVIIFDLWTGDVLAQSPIFTSLLITPATPLQPTFCLDSSGAFMFCASTPMLFGTLDEHFGAGRPLRAGPPVPSGNSVPMDSVETRFSGPRGDTASSKAPQTTSSVVCVLDFTTGHQVYQSSAEVSCLSIGSLAGDPAQLLLGSSDGSISVWHPPEAVSARIKELLQESARNFLAQAQRAGVDQLTPDELHAAVAWHWATYIGRTLDWKNWGEAPTAPAPVAGVSGNGAWCSPADTIRAAARHAQDWRGPTTFPPGPRVKEDVDDVVVQARSRWLPSANQAKPPSSDFGLPCQMRGEAPSSRPAAPPPAVPAPAPMPCPPSGRHPCTWAGVGSPIPPRWPGDPAHLQTLPRQLVTAHHVQPEGSNGNCQASAERAARTFNPAARIGDTGLLAAAPELQEAFGSCEEHMEDPVPSNRQHASLPTWLVDERRRSAVAKMRLHKPKEEAQEAKVVENLFGDIDQFERANPDVKVPDSPRSVEDSEGEQTSRQPLGGPNEDQAGGVVQAGSAEMGAAEQADDQGAVVQQTPQQQAAEGAGGPDAAADGSATVEERAAGEETVRDQLDIGHGTEAVDVPAEAADTGDGST